RCWSTRVSPARARRGRRQHADASDRDGLRVWGAPRERRLGGGPSRLEQLRLDQGAHADRYDQGIGLRAPSRPRPAGGAGQGLARRAGAALTNGEPRTVGRQAPRRKQGDGRRLSPPQHRGRTAGRAHHDRRSDRGAPLPPADAGGWTGWLEATAAATAMRQWLWLYPIVEILHIIGFVVLVGSAAMFDLRLLWLSRPVPVTGMERHLLPWPRGTG